MDTQNVLEKGRAALLLLSNKILSILNSRVLRGGLSTLIIIDLVAVILQSFSDLSQYRFVFSFITVISGLVFFVEYILRIISSPALFSDLGIIRSRLKYLFSFLGIIDFISILPFSVVFFHEGHILKDFIDLARILLIFKMLRYSNTYKMIFEVLHSVKYELITAMMFSALMICFSAILMYYIERDAQPDVFKNVGVGFWWAIITYKIGRASGRERVYVLV